jgi:hypothetical protein
MKFVFCAAIVAAGIVPLHAEEVFLTCQVTQMAASEKEGGADSKLKKIMKSIEKDESLKKYHSFKFISKKPLSATKNKSGSVKLKNKSTFSLTAVSVNRAQRKNTITVDVSVGGSSDRKSFMDRNHLVVSAGELDKKSDLLLAVSCPLFP